MKPPAFRAALPVRLNAVGKRERKGLNEHVRWRERERHKGPAGLLARSVAV